MTISDEYYTIGQAGQVIGVTRQTISRWIKQGRISGEKVGRETLIRRDACEGIIILGYHRCPICGCVHKDLSRKE